MKDKKYNFIEFVAATECEDFDVLEDSWLDWSKKFLKALQVSHIEHPTHQGSCTKESCSCEFCLYKLYLDRFEQYIFHEEDYRKEHL